MSVDGTYGFAYCGENDIGFGVFVVSDGRFRGCDYAGGKYDGTAIEGEHGSIVIDISFDVRPGLVLVEGTAPQDLPHRRSVQHTFPPAFGDGAPQIIAVPPGNLTVMVKRIRDEYAIRANGRVPRRGWAGIRRWAGIGAASGRYDVAFAAVRLR